MFNNGLSLFTLRLIPLRHELRREVIIRSTYIRGGGGG